MTIERVIDGKTVTIELTAEEEYQAYCSQQFRFDRMDVEDVMDFCDDETFEDEYGVQPAVFETLVDDMASELRRNIDKYDMSWQAARDDAIKTVIAEYQALQKKEE